VRDVRSPGLFDPGRSGQPPMDLEIPKCVTIFLSGSKKTSLGQVENGLLIGGRGPLLVPEGPGNPVDRPDLTLLNGV